MNIHLVTTGGTIEKIYSEQSGQVENQTAKIDHYLQSLRLPDTRVDVTALMNKDSLEMTEDDRLLVLAVVRLKLEQAPVVVTHGTDTMVETGKLLKQQIANPRHPGNSYGRHDPARLRTVGRAAESDRKFVRRARAAARLLDRDPQSGIRCGPDQEGPGSGPVRGDRVTRH